MAATGAEEGFIVVTIVVVIVMVIEYNNGNRCIENSTSLDFSIVRYRTLEVVRLDCY